MERFTYKFTDLFAFDSPSLEMWLAPTELVEFANIIANDMLDAHPDVGGKGMCVAVYDKEGTAVSMIPLGTVH